MNIPDILFLPVCQKDLYSIFRGTGIYHEVELFKSLDESVVASREKNIEPVVLSVHAKEMIRDGLELHLDNKNKIFTKLIPVQYIHAEDNSYSSDYETPNYNSVKDV